MGKTLILAEPGCTHEGSFDTLLTLLEMAHACGADVFKPQFTSDPKKMCERRHIGLDHPKRAYYERAYTWLAFPVEWHAQLRDRCHALGMKYAVTVFLPQDFAAIAPLVDYLKVSNFESGDPVMRKAYTALGRKKPDLFVSYGGGATRLYWGAQASELHCVSAYPAPLAALNLELLVDHNDDFSRSFAGYSDHSRHLVAGAVAVACGAIVVETHFRLVDCDPENPDFGVAFSPAEFAQYIRNIRDVEQMLGSGEKTIQPCEAEMLAYRVTA